MTIAEHSASLMIRPRKSAIARAPKYQCAGVYSDIMVIDPAMGKPTLVPFIPNTNDPANQVVCALHRFGRKMPKPDERRSDHFLAYAKEFIRMTWEQTLRDEDVPSFSQWLERANYVGSRKEQLRQLRDRLEKQSHLTAKVKSFIKWEGYFPKPKNARGINSPTDESKTILGPLFSAIDKCTFKARYFVKGTNPRDWPKKILDELGDGPVTETDFTSFESHHNGVFIKIVHYWMLHMIRNLTNIRPVKDLISRLVLGRNEIEFKFLHVEIDNRLMSGALWTSSSNGVLNLMIMSYLASISTIGDQTPAENAKWSKENFRGFVEGDDGLCRDYGVKKELMTEMGLVLDYDEHKNFSEANFCGINCDIDELVVLKDPIPAIAKMFVLPPKYKDACPKRLRGLMRARALSYLCNFSRVPVLSACCHWILRRTQGMCIDGALGVLESHQVNYARIAEAEFRARDKDSRYAEEEISDSSRAIVWERYGIPEQDQLRIEHAFRTCESDTCPIDLSDYTPNIVFHHALDFLYSANCEPEVRHQEVPKVVADILENGLKPTNASRKVAAVNARFKRWTTTVEPLS